MSFLLSECKELTYHQLVSINGGCQQGMISVFSTKIDSIIKNIGSKGGSSSYGTGIVSGPTTVTTGTYSSVSSGCSGGCGGKITTSVANGSITQQRETGLTVSNDTSPNKRFSYFIQKLLTTKDYSEAKSFGESACGATSLLNEIAEQYTREKGTVLSEKQAKQALLKAIEAGALGENNAFVKDWNLAAKAISESLGLKGKWTFTTKASEATATIISVDTKTSTRDYDGMHDHFVNDIGNGMYYDPYYNKTGYIKDLHLTSKWDDEDGIKSAYRYLKYEK